MKIYKVRPKIQIFDRNRNKDDSPCGFVLLFTVSLLIDV